MPHGWSMDLPFACNRRVENGDLVLWRDGFTAWLAVWNNDQGESAVQRLAWIKAKQSQFAHTVQETQQGQLLRYSYCLDEEGDVDDLAETSDDEREPKVIHAVYAFAFAAHSHVEIAIYCDSAAEVTQAQQMFASLRI